jgi:hypothetical protein
MNMFVVKNMLPGISTATIFRGVTPFVVAEIVLLAHPAGVPRDQPLAAAAAEALTSPCATPTTPTACACPIKLDSASNGEYAPIPLEPVHHRARRLAPRSATRNASKLGLDRRSFLVSACGAATSLLAMNQAYAAVGRRGSFYELEPGAALEQELARSTLDRGEFIFDVQGHFVNPTGAWLKRLPPGAQPLRFFTEGRCEAHQGAGGLDYLRCIGPEQFVKDVFMDSDTDLMVLSFVPSTREGEPLTIEEAGRRRESSSSSTARIAC